MTATPRTDSNRRMYQKRRLAVAVVALLALLGSYCAVISATPLPHIQTSLTIPATAPFNADHAPAQAAVDAQQLPTAAGWLDQDQVWSNDEGSYRIASLTKLITVLVGLEQAPVAAGSDGPSYTLTEADAALVDEVLAQDGSFAPAPVGLELTTRQMLDLILVPSANNYAISYSRWIFGSDEAFLAAAHDWLARHHLNSVHIEEAAGLSDHNVANAADVVRLARLALANPLVAEVVSQSVVSIPQLGEITTTNRLLGDAGVIGLKTGTTFPHGYSLTAAKREEIGDRDLVAIAVTLERADSDARAADTRAVLDAMAATGQPVELVSAGAQVGTAVTWTGAEVPLLAHAPISTTLVPGESATRTITLHPITAGEHGSSVGVIEGTLPTGDVQVAVVTGAAILEPDFFWRFSHPAALFGF